MSETILKIQDLTMVFGGIQALNKISFEVKKDSIHSLIGPNGAGKTTVFNCCTGFYTPTDGDIFFHSKTGTHEIGNIIGKPIKLNDLFAPYRLIYKFYRKMFGGAYQVCQKGMVRTFQNVRIFKELTVLENLLVAQHLDLSWNLLAGVLNTKGYREKNDACVDKAHYWLKHLGMSDDFQSLAGSLPYGKTRKLELARSMCTNPEIICLDEPAAGLNHKETDELSEVIKQLRSEYNVTVFLIEHDMHMVMKISDQIVVLDHGDVIAQGKPDEIKNNKRVIEAYLGVDDE